MIGVNKVTILGHVGRDPEVRYAQSGLAICNVSVATSRTWKSKDGEKQEETEWHRVTLFDRLAEVAGEYLKKGAPVYIEGRLKTRKYEKDGQDHYATEIMATELRLLGQRPDGAASRSDPEDRPSSSSKPAASKSNTGFDDMDDDIPF
jgi:single-strand DNA-binding protein